MLSKEHLQAIIAAWPDDEGRSSDPEVYDHWIERCRRYDARVIQNALGVTRILKLYLDLPDPAVFVEQTMTYITDHV